MDFDFPQIRKYFDFIASETSHQVLSDEVSDDLYLDLLFIKLGATKSKIGRQYFYSQFRLLNFGNYQPENYAAFFIKNPETRQKVTKELSKLNDRSDYQLLELITGDIQNNEKYLRYAQFSLFAMIAVVCCAFFVPKILILLIPFLIGNLYFHYANKNYVNYYNSILARLHTAISVAESLGVLLNVRNNSEEDSVRVLKSSIRFAAVDKQMSQNEFLFIFWFLAEIFNIVSNLEIFSFKRRVESLKRARPALLKIFEFIGNVDSSLSLAEIQEKYKTCTPEFTTEKELVFKNIYHPYIENCVENSWSLERNSAVITGSNMSGKTTFMRSVAVNVLFAQNFGFCFADYYRAPKMQIFSSIVVQDDISENKSYYLEEVLQIKKFLEARESFALILIDEIFKGTNTRERVAISRSVLKHLNTDKNIVIVTTHDLDIALYLQENHYATFYFDEDFNDGEPSFAYTIRQGINHKTNAIQILERFGYPEFIVRDAKDFL